jgi:hypothetical protein
MSTCLFCPQKAHLVCVAPPRPASVRMRPTYSPQTLFGMLAVPDPPAPLGMPGVSPTPTPLGLPAVLTLNSRCGCFLAGPNPRPPNTIQGRTLNNKSYGRQRCNDKWDRCGFCCLQLFWGCAGVPALSLVLRGNSTC